MKLSPKDEIEPFRAAIEAVQRLLAKFGNRGVIIGGIAVGFLGRPRLTEDVDAMFLLSLQDIPRFLEAAKAESLSPRIPEADEFARKNRVLLLQYSPTETNIDISLGLLPFEEEVVQRSIVLTTGTLSVRLPTAEDLIIMKAIAHRPKDLEDIRTIVDKNPGLDIGRIERWVQAFGEALETPALWQEIAGLLK
ncbi:MAG TPA: nucleotidyl transferase AbiEii/AbiGii toxin family protein [Anaerolineales bacterium]|nr:nucleotidyl transferase AbiEii/AbiGii toxin family protein [Anaerolineales bacterium]